MRLTSLHILWIFPLLTQLIFSLLSPFVLGSIGWLETFLFITLPNFLFTVQCYRQQYHQRNVLQLAFFSGAIGLFYGLIFFSLLSGFFAESTAQVITLWESTLAIVLYALMLMILEMMYALLILRLFLPKLMISREQNANT